MNLALNMFQKWRDYYELNNNKNFEQTLKECEQITDDAMIKFAEWLGKNVKLFDDSSGYFKLKDKFLPTTELQQYFKENVYGK